MVRILCFIILLNFLFLSCGPEIPKEPPESIFNKANYYMSKGEYQVAIELFYKLFEEYPDFKKYRADIIYRLGYLLYKTERYEEAEKILLLLIDKYKNYKNLKKAYIMLLHIYLEVFGSETKAEKLKNLYLKKFGADETYREIERTISYLKSSVQEITILKLPAKDLVIKKEEITDKFDREVFPVLNYTEKLKISNKKNMEVERKKTKEGYFLFLKRNGKVEKIKGSKNGYSPQWSWDDKKIIFTSMDWDTEEKKIKIFDIEKGKTFLIFKGKNIESVLCISPDSSKIVFGYMGKLWIINSDGSSVSLLHKDIKGNNISLMAWSKDGDKILLKREGEKKYHILYLGQREVNF